jgi:hypothetical protein
MHMRLQIKVAVESHTICFAFVYTPTHAFRVLVIVRPPSTHPSTHPPTHPSIHPSTDPTTYSQVLVQLIVRASKILLHLESPIFH